MKDLSILRGEVEAKLLSLLLERTTHGVRKLTGQKILNLKLLSGELDLEIKLSLQVKMKS